MNKSFEINADGGFAETDHVYGGGPPGGSNLTVINKEETWYYNSDLQLNYLGLRLGVDRSFLEGDFNVLVGSSVNCDFLIASKEDLDYLRTTRETTTNWNGTNTNTTYSDIVYSQAIYAVNSAYLNLGLNAAHDITSALFTWMHLSIMRLLGTNATAIRMIISRNMRR